MPNAWANAAVPPGTGTSSETTDAADGGARTSATNAATRDAASGRYTEPYFPPAGGQVEPRPSRRGHIIYGALLWQLARCGGAVSLARADTMVSIDLDLELPQGAVVPAVGRRIAEDVLIRQFIEQLCKRAAQVV